MGSGRSVVVESRERRRISKPISNDEEVWFEGSCAAFLTCFFFLSMALFCWLLDLSNDRQREGAGRRLFGRRARRDAWASLLTLALTCHISVEELEEQPCEYAIKKRLSSSPKDEAEEEERGLARVDMSDGTNGRRALQNHIEN